MRFCDAHYSFDCGCEPPAAPPVSSHVWVVVELYTKSVQIGRGPATDPIVGKQAIFARPEVTQQLSGRIVGVFVTENAARLSVPNRNGAEYIVERHEVTDRCQDTEKAPPPIAQTCITCGAASNSTFCPKCQKDHWAEMRALDPDWANVDA